MLEAVTVEALGVITATAAITSAAAAIGTLRTVRQNRRTLYGEEAVEHDNGLVGVVNEHEERLEEHEAVLIAAGDLPLTDGGPEQDDA